MENTKSDNEAVAVYDVSRRLLGSTAKTVVGIVLLVVSPIITIVIAPITMKYEEKYFLFILTWLAMIALLCMGPYLLSNRKQKGKLLFYDDRLSYVAAKELSPSNPSSITILPEQVSSIQPIGDNMIKIIYLGQTLCVISEQAAEIHQRITEMTKQSDPTQNSKSTDAISAEDIRKYKQLVDDGIISQEQFDEIIKKNT